MTLAKHTATAMQLIVTHSALTSTQQLLLRLLGLLQHAFVVLMLVVVVMLVVFMVLMAELLLL